MAERLYGLSDVGGTQQRVEVWNGNMELVGAVNGLVDPNDYSGSVESIAANMRRIADGNGELVAVSVAVASELDSERRLVLGGALSTWDGKCIGGDVGEAAGVPRERAGTLNDMEAVAESQLVVDAARGIYEIGYVTTLSSGWGGKPYSPENGGTIGYDSPGHAYLRDGAQCPCGGLGHTEAFLSGNGVKLNQGVEMQDWLSDRDNANRFVTDLSTATIALIERNARADFKLDVMRWMGGVATGQPVLMHRAEGQVREVVGPYAPAWESVTLGGKAGLHGAFIDARRLALAA
jgi:predicted NBD/HSP70 family sugar kinase